MAKHKTSTTQIRQKPDKTHTQSQHKKNDKKVTFITESEPQLNV